MSYYPPYPPGPSNYQQPAPYPPQQPLTHGYGRYNHPPPPVSVDEQFRLYLRSQLENLTTTVRPSIMHLTEVASQQISDYPKAIIVVEEIIARLERALPNHKLPCFYVLDSIAKNFPNPYAALFSPHIPTAFLSTYASVNGSLRVRLEEMLQTWRTGGSGGGYVFDASVQAEIENRIWGSQPVLPAGPPPPTRESLLAQMASVLAHRLRSQLQNPNDVALRRQIDVLRQLQMIVETSDVGPDDLIAIDKQLREISKPASPLPHAVPPSGYPPTGPAGDRTYGNGHFSYPATSGGFSPAPTTSLSDRSPLPVSVAPPVTNIFPPTPSHPPPSSVLPPPAAVQPATVSAPSVIAGIDLNMLNSLSNLISTGSPHVPDRGGAAIGTIDITTGTSSGANTPQHRALSVDSDDLYGTPEASAGVACEPVKDRGASEENDAVPEPDAYERLILGLNVRLETLNLKAPLPRISPIISTLFPRQCFQCSVRASDDSKGKARLDAHIDWHYRSNNRARNAEGGRGNSRAWFVDAKDWVNDHTPPPDSYRADDPVAGKAADGAEASKAPGGLTPAARQALMKEFVLQPADPEMASRPCPVCKEHFKGEYSDDEEDWVWKNAVNVDGVIYHAICRHDTLHSNALSSRLLTSTELQSRSRSSSPFVPAVTATAGVKTEQPPTSPLKKEFGSNASEIVVKKEAGVEAEEERDPVLGKRKSGLDLLGLTGEGGQVEGEGDAKRVKIGEV